MKTDQPSRQNNTRGVRTLQEVADILGIKRRAVEALEYRALRKLRNHPVMLRLAAEYGIAPEESAR